MQEKMFKVMERELDTLNESEQWKIADDETDNEDEGGPTADDADENQPWK